MMGGLQLTKRTGGAGGFILLVQIDLIGCMNLRIRRASSKRIPSITMSGISNLVSELVLV